ncbi:MAG: NAD(P)H-binding protein, partial [Solirubrobacteraceae bacterium]
PHREGRPLRVLVTGIGGYVGGLVAAELQRRGHAVRGYARRPRRVTLDVPVIAGDAVTGAGLDEALEGIDVAYFLIHSMEPASGLGDGFGVRERAAAERFAGAARRAGIRRIVYLGGPEPPRGAAGADGRLSPHLASRLEVERVLLDGVPGSVALRASIVIGAQSRAFRFLVRLIERLPVLILPAWRDNRGMPIDERDVVSALVACVDDPRAAGMVLDAAGPEVTSYGRLITRIADAMIVGRPTLGSGRLSMTPIASRIAATIAGEHPELIEPLMESLATDLLPVNPLASDVLGIRLHSLDSAIEHALAEWEREEPLAAR